jgi:hypothetical protein
MMADNKALAGMKDGLPALLTGYAYLSDPWSIVYETYQLIGIVRAMLMVIIDDESKADETRKRYKKYRSNLNKYIEQYNSQSGTWRKVVGDVGEIFDDVMEDVLKYDLISAKEGMFDAGEMLRDPIESAAENVKKW